ncbi:MAG: AI-2E family transporter [Anaerolineales bacterium]|jgi:predicted PurR-regulated permease PerM
MSAHDGAGTQAGEGRQLRDSRTGFQLPGRWEIRAWFLLFSLSLAIWFVIASMPLIIETFSLLFGALLVGLALEPLVGRVSRWIPRSLSVLLLYLILIGILSGLGRLLMPFINEELATLQSQGPALWNSISTTLSNTPLIGQLIPSPASAANTLAQRMDTLVQAIVGTVSGVGNAGLDIAVVFIVAYFGVVSKDDFTSALDRWIPPGVQDDLKRILGRVLDGLGRWVRAQPLVVLYFAFGFSVILALLGVPFALAIGLVGGVLSIIPFVGGFIAIILGVLSALTVAPILALWVTLAFAAWIELEGHLIAPAIFGRALRLHPALVLMAMLIGTKAGGLIGLLYSIPLTVVLMVLLNELRSRWMGEKTVEATVGSDA